MDVLRRDRHPDPDPCMRLTEVELCTMPGDHPPAPKPTGLMLRLSSGSLNPDLTAIRFSVGHAYELEQLQAPSG